MAAESPGRTEVWQLQGVYKKALHERILRWGERVVPMFESMKPDERARREHFFEFLMTSVEREDKYVANIVAAVDETAKSLLEGPGPYGRGGGSINSPAGDTMCQSLFEGLFAIFETGRHAENE